RPRPNAATNHDTTGTCTGQHHLDVVVVAAVQFKGHSLLTRAVTSDFRISQIVVSIVTVIAALQLDGGCLGGNEQQSLSILNSDRIAIFEHFNLAGTYKACIRERQGSTLSNRRKADPAKRRSLRGSAMDQTKSVSPSTPRTNASS